VSAPFLRVTSALPAAFTRARSLFRRQFSKPRHFTGSRTDLWNWYPARV
jgi:hypothetical protein